MPVTALRDVRQLTLLLCEECRESRTRTWRLRYAVEAR